MDICQTFDRKYAPFNSKSALQLVRGLKFPRSKSNPNYLAFARKFPGLSFISFNLLPEAEGREVNLGNYIPLVSCGGNIQDLIDNLRDIHDLLGLKTIHMGCENRGSDILGVIDLSPVVRETEMWLAKGFEERGRKVNTRIFAAGVFVGPWEVKWSEKTNGYENTGSRNDRIMWHTSRVPA